MPIDEPFSSLYAQFRKLGFSCSRIIVIGFAFRDDYLRGVFIEFLKHTKGNMVIVLSPSAKEAAKTLLGKEANLDRQVIALESSFGDKMALAELGGALGIVN